MCVAPFPHRLVKAVLGVSSVAAEKLEEGPSMVILGVESTVSDSGLRCIPDKKKRTKWIARIKKALASKKLTAGEASKLSGALQWATQNQFRRLGRAMLRPIYDQKTPIDGRMSNELRRALTWWIQILESNLCERRSCTNSRSEPEHQFCDASGSPAHSDAVHLIDNECYFTHYVPPAAVVNGFRRRSDNQIMGLELLSMSLGLCTFADLIRGRNVVVHSDNTGAEVWSCMCAVCHMCH